MANSKGKQFESVVHESFEKLPDVSVDRLRDAPKKQKGVDNPADFIVYKKPHEVYVECKSHKGNTLPFSCIRPNQIEGMTQKAKIEGVKCGLLIWYIEHDATIWVPIETVNQLIAEGEKSIHYFKIINRNHIVVHGKKKRVYFEYDMNRFLEELYE